MKIHLILEYKRQGNNVWADVQAFTSPRQRDAVMAEYPEGTDMEGVDVEVSKRAYIRKDAPLPDVEASNVG